MMRVFSLAVMALVLATASHLFSDEPEAKPDDLFKKLDVNGDGKLTSSEIPQQHRKFFERLLRIGDADKNGELTREEFDHALKQSDEPVTDLNKMGNLGGGPPARPNLDPKRLFQTLDKNKDGKLTRDELEGRPRLLALFERLGKDELTIEDLTAGLANARKPNAKKLAKKAAKKGALAMSDGTAENKDSKEMSDASENHTLPGIFQLLDTNHDGRLSQEELSKAAALFDKLDLNHDGFLDPKEFMGPPAKNVAEETSAPSIRPGKRVGNRSANQLVEMVMRADADGDGKISQQEAPKQLKKHFAKIDTNGDGYLDRSELEAWAKRVQKRQAALNGGQDSAQNTEKKPTGL